MTVLSVGSNAIAPQGVDAVGGAARSRVLNAVSGSAASQRATIVAAALASEHAGELVIVHVRPPSEMRVVRLGPAVVRTRWLDDPFGEPVLLQARRLAWTSGVMPRIVLMDGRVTEGVAMAAREWGSSLVVIGWRARWLPATTRTRIQRSCPVPVLAVSRGGAPFMRVDGSVPELLSESARPC